MRALPQRPASGGILTCVAAPMSRRLILAGLLLAAVSDLPPTPAGAEYGDVVLNRYSTRAGVRYPTGSAATSSSSTSRRSPSF